MSTEVPKPPRCSSVFCGAQCQLLQGHGGPHLSNLGGGAWSAWEDPVYVGRLTADPSKKYPLP